MFKATPYANEDLQDLLRHRKFGEGQLKMEKLQRANFEDKTFVRLIPKKMF